MKVKVEVKKEFDDLIYDKHRTVGDIFVCDSEIANSRANLEINGRKVSLVKILGEASKNDIEEEKTAKSLETIGNLFRQYFK